MDLSLAVLDSATDTHKYVYIYMYTHTRKEDPFPMSVSLKEGTSSCRFVDKIRPLSLQNG